MSLRLSLEGAAVLRSEMRGDATRGVQGYVTQSILVDGTPSRDVEHSAGCERTVLGRQPRDHGGRFAHEQEPVHGDLREHEVDMLLLHLVEDLGPGRGRRNAVHKMFEVASSLPSDFVSPISPALDD